MAIKICLLLLLTLSLLLLPIHCYTKHQEQEEEEESAEGALFECLVKCDKQPRNEEELTHCEQRCVNEYQDRKRQEREHDGGGGGGENHHHYEPEQQYKTCQSKCGRQEQGQQRQYCQQKCQWQYEKQKREQQGRERGRGDDVVTNSNKKSEEKQESKNPYFFQSERFVSKYKTQEGHIKVLERFSKKSELLKGIENYRLAILEANPNTFVLPHHCDAESVFVVVGRQSYNLKRGDVMRVPAGSIVYLINRDDNERLYVLKLLQPVNTPGRFKEYFGVGGENPESFFRTFSNEILEAAFNTPRERLEKLFGQQRKGVIIKASKEQIRALSQETESSRGRRGESWGPFNLLDQQPLFSSNLGQYFEASPNDYQQLKDLDVSVGFMHIKQGGMVAPYYNSRSTKLVFVVGGSGQFEMACPHVGTQTKQQGRKEKQGETRTDVHYEKISGRLSVGDAFIIPAGHPIAIIASQDSNLQLASFGIKGSYDQKYFLVGQENIWNQVESEAKELSFKMPAREVEEIFKSQEQSYFLPGPGQREERKGHNVASILDFVGF
ncbi:hypothetical protein DH2020_036033 [Rehmannia glutinosa]|uniref:Cupin type-1 domain-containing protein n=1 Tax=Rehmannia glutinosa TaxID=99300 RepID=A0ABR0V4S6_REHGL